MIRIAIDINDVIRDYTRQFMKLYQKVIDSTFDMEYEEVEDFDFCQQFGFKCKEEYNKFKFEDCAFELHCRAELCDSRLSTVLNDWVMNVLGDIDEEVEVIYFSPFEMHLTIQSTLGFLSAHGARVREYYFPIDSMTIYDKADIVITANPNLIKNVPEGKCVIKIEAPYNKENENKYTFKSLYDLITDKDETIINIVKNFKND